MKIENSEAVNLFVLRQLQQSGALEEIDLHTLLALSMESGFLQVVIDQARLADLVRQYQQMTPAEIRQRKRFNEFNRLTGSEKYPVIDG